MTAEKAIEILEGLAVPVSAEAAFDMAIDVLEKQIPMKPLAPKIMIGGKIVFPCGNCGDALDYGDYCSWCGQRIKW